MDRKAYRKAEVDFRRGITSKDPASWSVQRRQQLGLMRPGNSWLSRAGMLSLLQEQRKAGTLFEAGADRAAAYRATLQMVRHTRPGPNLP